MSTLNALESEDLNILQENSESQSKHHESHERFGFVFEVLDVSH